MKSIPGRSLLLTALVFLLLLAGWFWSGSWYHHLLVNEERAKVAEQIAARANALTSSVNQRIALLQGLYAFTTTEWPDNQFDQTFEIYCSGIYFNTTGLRTLIIAPEGITRYVYPLYDFQTMSGYDVLNDNAPNTRADVQRAIHTHAITLSQPGELHQGGFGLTAWRAVFRGYDLWGLVSISLDMNTILTDAGFTAENSPLSLALLDGNGKTFYGADTVWQQNPVSQSILLPEGAWQLGGLPQGGWDAPIRAQERLFRLGSLAIVLLLTALVYAVTHRQARLAEAVAVRTRQIAAAQTELEVRVQERTRELSTLLDVSQRINTSLTLAPLLDEILPALRPVMDFTQAAIFQFETPAAPRCISQTGAAMVLPATLLESDGLAQIMRNRQPLIIPAWQPVQPGPACCWLGVPLAVQERTLGVIIFLHRQPDYYQPAQASLALAFAQQLAAALENARLYEQAGQLAVLQERQRLARELHDSVSQVLYSIGLGAKSARTALDRHSDQAGEAIDYVSRLAEAGQVEMRALIFELRPESLRTDGLIAALDRQIAVLRARHQLKVIAQLGAEPAAPLEIKEAVYRIFQEACYNIVRHARASQVRITLRAASPGLILEIEDDGVGFDPVVDYPGHLGLRSMHERAADCGGRLEITSRAGQGTHILLTIPIFGPAEPSPAKTPIKD